MMTKSLLRFVVKEAYDRAVLEGKVEFSDKYSELCGMSIGTTVSTMTKAVATVTLNFGSGFLYLITKENTRKSIIDTFTDFLWARFVQA